MDITAVLDSYSDSWEDYWDDSLTPYQNSYELLSKAIALPYSNIQLPIAISYAWTNAKWARCLGIHLAYGPEGSGKSTIAKFARGLREGIAFGDGSTFASIRNYLQSTKYQSDEDGPISELDGAALILDNVYSSTFQGADNKLRSLILCGYKKADDRLTIAQPGNGENIEFRTFSTKLISSVDPIHECHDLRELKRRLVFTFHEKWEQMNEAERPEFDMTERIDFDELDWSGMFKKAYMPVYGTDAGQMGSLNVHVYGKFKTALKRYKKWPKAVTSERKEIMIDLLSTGRIIEAWDSIEAAACVAGTYWEFIDSRVGSQKSDLEQVLVEMLDIYELAASKTGKPSSVPTTTINKELERRYSAGDFLERPKASAVRDILFKRGYRPEKSASGNMNWVST
ncbi:MAG: hypothetical protein AAGF93_05475 [Cyanobacteria bacterium P01_H01_bin.105]